MALRARDIALFGSLLVNALFVGVAIGGTAAGLRVAPPPVEAVEYGRGRGVNPRTVIMALPAEERSDARAALRAGRPAMRALLNEVREARLEAARALAAEPFDPEAVRSAFERTRAAHERLRAHSHEAVVALFERMPPAQRAEIANAMAERLERRRHRRGPWRERRPPGGP